MSKKSFLFVAISPFLAWTTAHATTEIPGMFDARSSAMAGTGVAHGANPTAAQNNPAMLDGIKTLSITADITPYTSKTTMPLPDGTRATDDNSIVPLFFAGGAYRVHERVVVGLAVYPTAGMSGAFKDKNPAGGDLTMSASILELAVPVALRISDNLSIGVGWRATYIAQTMSAAEMTVNPADGLPVMDPDSGAPMFTKTDIDVSGMNFAGFEAGVRYQPIPMLTLGLSYRSAITTTLSGDTTMTMPAALGGSAMKLDTETDFTCPHGVRAGAALSLLESKLLIALDSKYLFYKSANKETKITLKSDLIGGEMTQTVKNEWKDALSVHLGAEYQVSPMLLARAGYSYVGSATNEDTVQFYETIPGALHGLHFGVGVPVTESLSIDAAGLVAFGKTSTDAGDYDTKQYLGLLSATYHK